MHYYDFSPNIRNLNGSILFVTYGGGHVELVVEIWRALRSSGIRSHILALTSAENYLKQLGDVDYISLASIFDANNHKPLRRYGTLLSGKIWSKQTGIPKQSSIIYMGLGFLSLIEQYGLKEAKNIYRKVGRKGFLPVEFCRLLFQWLGIEVVITTCNVRMEKATVIAANELNLKSIRVDDMMGSSFIQGGDLAFSDGKLITASEFPTFGCVANPAVFDALVRHGAKKSSLKITGQPAVEGFCNRLRDIRGIRKIQSDQQLRILWIGPGRDAVEKHFLSAVKAIAGDEKFDRLLLRYRQHPKHGIRDLSLLQQLVNKGRIFFTSSVDPLLDDLAWADIVVVFHSTVAITCLNASIPIVVYEPDQCRLWLPFVASDDCKIVKGQHELKNVLSDVQREGLKVSSRSVDGVNSHFQVISGSLDRITAIISA